MKYLIMLFVLVLTSCSSSSSLNEDIAENLTRQYVTSKADNFFTYCFYTTVVEDDVNNRFVGYAKNCYTECVQFGTENHPHGTVAKILCNRFLNKKIKDHKETQTKFKLAE